MSEPVTAPLVDPQVDAVGSIISDQGRRPWTPLFEPIRGELQAVDDLLRRELRSDDPHVDELVKHAFRLGGKRLRPALLLLSAKASQAARPEHIVLGCVVEMIHTATLVHDDVLDEATLRRHRQTINAKSSNEASVLVGDFLFTHAFSLASSLETTFACRVIGRATNVVCAGELRQIHSRGNFDLSESEYLDIIEAKTAELCACCCQLGAHYAGAAPEVERALANFGRKLGIAFQIADDLLDLIGDEARAGKSLGTDLNQQKPTLPLIWLLAKSSADERREIVETLSRRGAAGRQALAGQLAERGALEYAQRRAQKFAEQALAELDVLPESPARAVLSQLTELVISRGE